MSTLEAGFQYRRRASPYDYSHLTNVRFKTAQSADPSSSASHIQLPRLADTTYRSGMTTPSPSSRKNLFEFWRWEQGARAPDSYMRTTEEWVTQQIHLTDRPNYERRDRPMDKEELRQRMWDELMYEYEAEAQKWMKHEAEMRWKAQEQQREEARRRSIQEDISKIQTRVRQRRDSERQTIADERRRNIERAKEMQRREQARLDRAVLEAWNSYESRWMAISSNSKQLHFKNVPWPMFTSPESSTVLTPDKIAAFILHPSHSPSHSPRERIRSALLRWHPDRFRRLLQRVPESERQGVEEGACAVTQCLNDLLGKEGRAGLQGK